METRYGYAGYRERGGGGRDAGQPSAAMLEFGGGSRRHSRRSSVSITAAADSPRGFQHNPFAEVIRQRQSKDDDPDLSYDPDELEYIKAEAEYIRSHHEHGYSPRHLHSSEFLTKNIGMAKHAARCPHKHGDPTFCPHCSCGMDIVINVGVWAGGLGGLGRVGEGHHHKATISSTTRMPHLFSYCNRA